MAEQAGLGIKTISNNHQVFGRHFEIHVHPKTHELRRAVFAESIGVEALVKSHLIDRSQPANIFTNLFEAASIIARGIAAVLCLGQAFERIEDVHFQIQLLAGKTQHRRAEPLETAKFGKIAFNSVGFKHVKLVRN